MKRFALLLLAIAMSAGTASAHNGMEHVMGTIVAINGNSISVKNTKGVVQTVIVSPQTHYLCGNDPTTLLSIHPGDRVVIHAVPKNGQLNAAEVKTSASK